MAGKFVISKTSNGKFHFVLKAGNGEVILSSQVYADLDGATKGIASARENGPNDARFQRLASTRGEPYFNLVAANGQVIGRSEMYSSERARDNGIESVKKNAADAGLDDRSADAPDK
jgi:uncharacterized protein YegP (UPF0339 family)